MRGARYEGNRLTSEGRFDAIPVRTVLALAGVPPDTGGTLRLSGAWSLATTPRWNGTLSVGGAGDRCARRRNADAGAGGVKWTRA